MINNFEETLKFQQEQQNVVIRIGAFLTPIKDFIEKSQADLSYADDINNIRRLQPHVGDISFLTQINDFLRKYNYSTYYGEILTPYHHLASLLAIQTLPRKKKKPEEFLENIRKWTEAISEAAIAIAQIPSPSIDAHIKAQSPFQAYCFFTGLLLSVKDFFYLVDPYLDVSIFYNYFFRLPKTTKIQIASSPEKWNRTAKEQIEALEPLFQSEYPNYSRKNIADLHDRFIITETAAFQLGGSLKDAAKKSDFSVVQISEARRLELINQYFQ